MIYLSIPDRFIINDLTVECHLAGNNNGRRILLLQYF